MSNENTKETLDQAKNIANNLLSTLLSLKEKNPKVFFGAIAGIVVIFIVIAMSGGSSKTVSGPVMKNLAVGQR